MSKECYMCKQIKALSEYDNNISLRDGKCAYCRECGVGYHRQMYYKRIHGITIDERNTLLLMQDSKCKICFKPIEFNKSKGHASNTGDSAVVDHCHVSKKIRGILCGACNSILGKANDDRQILLNAVQYLSDSDDI